MTTLVCSVVFLALTLGGAVLFWSEALAVASFSLGACWFILGGLLVVLASLFLSWFLGDGWGRW